MEIRQTKDGILFINKQMMETKTIKSRRFGIFTFHTSGRYLYLNDRQCTDRDGNAITVDGDFLAVVKKYYASLIRQRKKLE